MTKLCLISDTHTQHSRLIIPECDILIHAGDISYFGRANEIASFCNWFRDLSQAKHKVFIAGNHDHLFQKDPLFARQFVPNNVHYLQDSCVELEGWKIYGTPWTPYFFDWAFNGTDKKTGEDQGPNLLDKFKRIPDDTDILISHGPAVTLLDLANEEDKKGPDRNCGSKMLYDRIFELTKLKLFVCGHIHEGYGKLEDISNFRFTYVNASSLDRTYSKINEPIVVEL